MSSLTASPINQAWMLQRDGKTAEAVAEFERVIKAAPDDIDALYGLGLTLRYAGRKAEAIQYFQQALNLVEQGHASERTDANMDRWLMLTRMIRQRLAELGA